MSRKTLAAIIVGVGVAEILLIFPFAFWGGNFGLIISLLLLMPVLAIAVVWWKVPQRMWGWSLSYTWAILVGSLLLYVFNYFGSFSDVIGESVVAVGYSVIFGTLWFAALMIPVGSIMLMTRSRFNQNDKADNETTKNPVESSSTDQFAEEG